jgi:hypothetical protein
MVDEVLSYLSYLLEFASATVAVRPPLEPAVTVSDHVRSTL